MTIKDSRGHLSVLDGLRGVAVLLVVWFHMWQTTWLSAPQPIAFIAPVGFIGVDLFLFLSGFVIAYPFVLARSAGGAQPAWTHFFKRRAMKIVPSYALSIMVAFAIGVADLSSGISPLRAVLTHVFFVHNLWPDAYGSINGVLWSLAVEVQFYALFPFIWGLFSRWPIATWIALIAGSTAYRMQVYASGHEVGMRMEWLPAHIGTFACGMIAAWAFVLVAKKWPDGWMRTWFFTVMSTAGAAACVALMLSLYSIRYAVNGFDHWEVLHRSLLDLAFSALALGGLLAAPLWQRLIGNKVFVFLGFISYNLYLYHKMVALKMLALHIPAYHTADPHNDPHWMFVFFFSSIAISIGISVAVTRWFEVPFLRRTPIGMLRDLYGKIRGSKTSAEYGARARGLAP